MRKTTDPKEHKYLTDREFNTFGRGAIEDAPGELLYGKGALAKGFNVNCYNSYFEGRTGSDCVEAGRDRTWPPVVSARWAEKVGRKVWGLNTWPDDDGWETVVEGQRYIDWTGNDAGGGAAGYRDVVIGAEKLDGIFLVESDAPRHSLGSSGFAVLRDKPMLLAWHDTLNCYVRVEGGRFYVMRGEKWEEVFAPERSTCGLTLGRKRCTFIPGKTGGFLYTLEGIYRWISDENVIVKINRGAPLTMDSKYSGPNTSSIEDRHVYHYEFTGLRLRGRGRVEDPVNTIVDFETPVSEHNFLPYRQAVNNGGAQGGGDEDGEDDIINARRTGVLTRSAPHNVGAANNKKSFGPIGALNGVVLSGFEWAEQADVGAMTHIGVYRTLDIKAIDPEGEANSTWVGVAYNSPNLLGLVMDVPMATVLYGTINRVGSFEFRFVPAAGSAFPGRWDLHSEFVLMLRNPSFNIAWPVYRYAEGNYDQQSFLFRPALSNDPDVVTFWNPWGAQVADGAEVILYTSHSETAFAVEVASDGRLRRSGGMDISDSIVGRAVFLSDGEAYTVASRETEGAETYLTLTRPIAGNPAGGTMYGAVAVTPRRERIWDYTDDDTLRPRRTDWYPRTRFCRALPNCNVAAAVPGFVLCAIEGESTLRYTADDGMGGYTNGSHNPIQINEQVSGGITQLTAFPDVCAVMIASATWAVTLGVSDYYKEPGSGWIVPIIPKINIVDNRIGCAFPRTVQYVSGGEIIMFTRIGGEAAVVLFNGHQYGENMLVDTALGLSRNQNRARDAARAVAIYGESTGYIVWMTMGEDERDGDLAKTISSYCFSVAVRSTQGGGVTEYGGEGWLWPDADAGVAVTGRDGAGAAVVLVEDARTGFLFRIGVAEQWLDKTGLKMAEWGEDPRWGSLFVKYPDVGGRDIETRVALPVISDGYKWQKHLETHIAMRCWKSEYRKDKAYTKDGFKPNHTAGLKIYEDGEQIAEESALQDLNRNGDYAYLKKIDARRIQEVIETTTSAYKISQVIAKVQTSDREALPVDNEPIEVAHQREWRTAVIHLSRNLPCPTYNRADGTEMDVIPDGGAPGKVGKTTGPTGKTWDAFWTNTGMTRTFEEQIIDFTTSMWIKPHGASSHPLTFADADDEAEPHLTHEFAIEIVGGPTALEVRCVYDGCEILRWPLVHGKWQQIALRRKVNGAAERFILFYNGVPVVDARVARTVQNTVRVELETIDPTGVVDDIWFDTGTVDEGISYQNTVLDYTGESVFVGRKVTVARRGGCEYYDVRLVFSAVSAASIWTYYNAVRRGGEGWLP
jgi:hypothetical protein